VLRVVSNLYFCCSIFVVVIFVVQIISHTLDQAQGGIFVIFASASKKKGRINDKQRVNLLFIWKFFDLEKALK